MRLDVRLLKSFIVVAQEGKLGRAAQRLHISQPPLTRQIRQLETELGTELFLRTSRGMELTDAGRTLLRDAINIRELLDQATERVRRIGKGELGQLEVGVFGSAILKIIPGILAAFRQQYPEVRVALHTGYHAEQLEAVRQGRIALVLDRFAPEAEDIRVEPVASEPVVVAMHRSNPLARKRVISVGMLRNEPMLMPEGLHEWSSNVTLRLFRAHGFEPVVSQQVTDVITGVSMVGAGFGTCLAPASATALNLPDVVFRPLREGRDEPYRLHCYFLRNAQSPLIFRLLSVAQEYGRRLAVRNELAMRRAGKRTAHIESL